MPLTNLNRNLFPEGVFIKLSITYEKGIDSWSFMIGQKDELVVSFMA